MSLLWIYTLDVSVHSSGFASPLGKKKMQQSSQVEVFKKIFGQGYSGDAKKKKYLLQLL